MAKKIIPLLEKILPFVAWGFFLGGMAWWFLAPESRLATIEYNKGIDFFKREDWDVAIACYSEAIRLKPDYADAYYNRGIAYSKKGESDAAIKDFSEAIRLKPDDATAYYNRGNAYSKKGDKAKANADFAKADELEAKK